ncbi:MAG TPA: ribosome assembly RNA-binding protein YhbY [Polyangiaceae bacterium]
MANELSGKATRYLRGLGHDLSPVVNVGKEGVTEALVKATKEALLAHELIKVKVQPEAPIDRKSTAADLAAQADAALAQVLGRTFLLYKRHPKKPKIAIPGEKPIEKEAKSQKASKPRKTGRPVNRRGASSASPRRG